MSKLMRGALLSATMLCAHLTGAAAQEPNRAEVMHWWTSGGEAAGVRVFADAYEKAGGTWVDAAIAGGQNLRAAAINRIVGGNPPTSSQFNTGRQFDDLVGQGLLVDLDTVAGEGKWRDVIPAPIVNAASREGKFYAVPVNIHGHNWMFYNTATLQKAGITEAPKTFDAFFADMDKLKAAGVTPIAWGGQPWQEALVFDAVLLGQGGRDLFLKVYRDKDEEAITSEAFQKVAETFHRMRDYVDAGAPGRNWNDATNMVITGQAGVQIMGDWAKGDFIAAGMTPGDDAGCALVPGETGYVMGGDVFVFPKLGGGAATEAQNLLARTMLDPATQIAFNEKKGSIPVRTDVDVSGMDACARRGAELVRDPANQVPSVNFHVSADTVGALQDTITSYFNDPAATPENFAADFASVIGSAD
ncbi:ABC transporter substrate-binding protein [Aureimonas phyllosphaerae]|uniref:Probable sugar-binding periplasmic protein n=1 Tax=Aureimonas phyllosphaerae TaxID=1166078 RepID=A0A7W6FT61_9HYPH|nr:ABC transporter substrate-binding protein [Aureimonas phyllosphaerae]MBB3934683.1 glucose/mannose transport system substrate-binding protein [Aureimonas phyllosphaerae]MBB3958101.1 glucose/mannose transport system substrate-binding protein [Aureimonas phyllosphaerae]SFE91837.1 carbohydrate ABC transporter substrate-binding protein, CUT1 family [Aureimonas phyllosphaerae]